MYFQSINIVMHLQSLYQIAFTPLNHLHHIHMANMIQPQKQFRQKVLYLQQEHHVSFKVVK